MILTCPIWWIVVSLVAAVSPTAGSLPTSTLDALRALWEQTGGEQWSRCQWTPDLDPCAPPWGLPHWSPPNDDDDAAWGASVCFVCNTSVTTSVLLAIDMSSNGLMGTLPDFVWPLTSLQYLDLGNNQLSGPIPASLGSLTSLTNLGLSNNHLTGTIPQSLGNLVSLTVLTVSYNRLTGSIPAILGNLSALTYLALFNNQLFGSIPESLGSLTALMALALSDNQLVGTIPDSFGNLLRLTYLGLYNNHLTGTIPESICNLLSLNELALNNNALTGRVPASLGRLTTLTQLDLSSNQLVGGIPESLGDLTALTALSLSENHLTGAIPESLGNLTSLTFLGLSANQLTGTIPESLGNIRTLIDLALPDNLLTGPIPASVGNLTALTKLALFENQLSGMLPHSLGNLTALTYLGLYDNQLTGPIPESIGNLTSLAVLLISNNNLTGTLPDCIGNLTGLRFLALRHNQLTGAIPQSLGRLTALTQLALSYNQLTGTIPESFRHLGQLDLVDLSNNNLSEALEVTPPVLAAFQGSMSINLAGNNIVRVGPMFDRCTNPNGRLDIDLSNNLIGSSFLESPLASASRCASSLSLDLSQNSITSVVFANLANYTLRYCTIDPCPQLQTMDFSIDLSHNPIGNFDIRRVPVTQGLQFSASVTGAITVGLANLPTSFRFNSNDSFDFTGIRWDSETGGTLNVSFAANSKVQPSVVRALSTAPNSPATLNVNLSWNNYTELAAGVLNGSRAASIDLSHNSLTRIADDAVDYNFELSSLHLSSNFLTILSSAFLDRLPGLTDLTVDHNELVALPATNNHLALAANAAHNPIQCANYGPTAGQCSCPHGYHFGNFSGYIRCTLTSTGCPSGLLWNKLDTSNAPWSTCVNGSVPQHYFYNNTFLPITNCSTYLTSTGKRAYQVQAPLVDADGSATSDRLCSLCSTCPSGYHATPCTEISDTKCTQLLSPAAVAAIVLSIVLLLIVGLLGAGYGRTQKQQRYQTQTELELTERLLGDVQDEKERAVEEIADMEHAWAIAEDDLGFGAIIGEGAYGRVFRGTWGHIPVAIKILRHPLDELDQTMRNDFDREVKFMRSIRHPHILIFYGAGVDSGSRAFLVTELMAGSLKTLLLNHQIPLGWDKRLTFATDIASGMVYLHDRGTVHRDLKADNCFLSEDHRIKVADFGTGRIATHIQESTSSDTTTTDFSTAITTWSEDQDIGRTLSKGVGSLLWMAPEALRGARLKDGQGPALDVYSYAIVLWEIWSRARPWDEVQEEGIQFSRRLTELVNAGVRPKLTSNCEQAPEGYQTLMEKCWAGRPDHRPRFTAILSSLSEITNTLM